MKALLFLKWLLYFILTMDARGRYMQGQSKGMHCIGQRNGPSGTVYYFDPNKNPFREYLTWKEWWDKNLNRIS